MLRNRRFTGWWLGLLVAVLILTAIAPLRGETAPVVPDDREMKLLLQPDYFADRNEGYLRCWATVKVLAVEMGIPVAEGKNPLKEGVRKVVFLDTGSLDLTKKDYIIRQRIKVADGVPADKGDLTLKYRVSGAESIPSEAVKAADNFKASVVYQEDFVGFAGGVIGENVGEMANSHTIKGILVADMEGKTLGDFARYFPTLAKLGIPLDAPLVVANGISVREYKISPGVFDFGQGVKSEVDISLWYDFNTGKAITAEISYECPRGPNGPADAIAKAEDFFRALQQRLAGVLYPGKMKAQFVTEK